MTPKGRAIIEEELHRLIGVEREKLRKALHEAMALGDLSENSEYKAAKESQSKTEGRILELQGKIAHAQVINPSKLSGEKIVFGATVHLTNLETNSEVIYQIVGDDEASLANGTIACSGPISKALIGKTEGDIVVVKAPKGEIEYEIRLIEFK
jgi:transcription elongation factor GreA